ncbi:MAG TPA: tetratricopeptide repeat protein [Gemmatimonadaceae bacterium]|nr:tetratricopeptide repeat protein [Gemmatimonadaceae bacterium]
MAHPADGAELLPVARALAARGDWEGLRAWLEPAAASTGGGAEIVLLLAEAELRLGDPARARSRLDGAIPALARLGDRPAQRRALNLLGAARFEVGELEGEEGAEEAFSRALELANEDGDALLVARATNNLGAIANIRGRRDAALAMYQLAVPAYQRIGSAVGLAECFHNMAITYRDARHVELADECERRAIEFAREAGSARLLAMARAGRAELSLLRGDARLAHAGATLAAAEYGAIPDPVGEADALRLVGAALAALGERTEALDALERAVRQAHEHGSALIEGEALLARAALHLSTGERESARVDAGGAHAIFTRLGATAERQAVERLLASLAIGE